MAVLKSKRPLVVVAARKKVA